MNLKRVSSIGLFVLMAAVSLRGAAPELSIVDAAKHGNRTAVQNLVKQRVNVNATDTDGSTPLHFAAEINDVAMARMLLTAGAKVQTANRYGVTPLWLAAQNGNPQMVEAFLKAGADANAVFGDGQTVLMTAARTGNAEVVKALISYGAKVDAKEGVYGETALMMAATQNNGEAIKTLLENGAKINETSTVIHVEGGGFGSRKYDAGGFTAVLFAAREGAMDAVRVLADAHADLNAADKDGFNPMIFAILNGHYDVAALLLEKGADPNAVDASGRGALYAAVDQNTFEWSFNRPPALPSGKLNAVDVVKKLLAAGADPNQRLTRKVIPAKHTTDGNPNLTKGATPFMKAASTADVELMRLLLDWGADPYLTNDVQTNALMIAAGVEWRDVGGLGAEANAIEALKICMSYGLDVNAFNRRGQTAMHGAAMRGGDSIVKFLLAQGASLDVRDKTNRTPLDEALGRPAGGGGADYRHDRKNSTVTLIRQLLANGGKADGAKGH